MAVGIRSFMASIVVLVSACGQPRSATEPVDPRATIQAASEAPSAVTVSMVQLLASPRLFDGKNVRVQGALRIGNEERALYLSNDDADHFNYAAGVWLDTRADQALTSGFVTVEGIFDAGSRGHEDLWPAAIRGITRIEKRLSRVEYPKEVVAPSR
jgi:hypothetical protein